MLTPINAQVTSPAPTSANSGNARGSDGDNGFGSLLKDTKARRQSDTESAGTTAETRSGKTSQEHARGEDTGADKKTVTPHHGAGGGITEGNQPAQAINARRTLSNALDQLQGNRLDGRERPDEMALHQGTDRARPAQANLKGADDSRQIRLAALSGDRTSLEALNAERAGSALSKTDKSVATRGDGRSDTINDKGKRLTEHDQTDDASALYALIDTGFVMPSPAGQKGVAGREGALPARGAMLEQGLRGRDSAGLDTTLSNLKGRDQDVRGDRLFGEILSQREGLLSRAGGTSNDATFGTQFGQQSSAPTASDNPLSSLTALTGQSGTNTMAAGTAQAVTTATLPAMDSDQWSSAFERQVISLSMRGGGEARLNMNPLELGPLSISLKMGEQSAQLHIASHHAQVRAAIEAALPQLRDAFSASGIELGQTSVSDQGSFQQSGFQQQQERTPGGLATRDGSNTITGIDTDADVISISAPPGRSLNGGIDLFA
ncbi:flagellar hook-length control protein FliK [Kushneria marisflavi]|uniref:Uncharacterized protein n=1 Tax=Kushneria marisflavi TaxID=157779 RepID=A0A240UTR9_9GAMM|nr:flagellar hook-length control protein FliK [Kushneria marisflavi]ART64442.1 hypothetical protein B9H00_16385 [Kushneria marisflavi]RKD86596.1 flagellar hook-length control protein FliK [Kushneria marisflavi]